MFDIEYIEGDMFTTFMPNTKAGESVCNTIAAQNDGVAKVLNMHADSVFRQIRKAGYSVGKANQVKIDMDALMAELEGVTQ